MSEESDTLEILESDYVIRDPEIYHDGKFLYKYEDMDDGYQKILDNMDKEKLWTDVFDESDHGNIDLDSGWKVFWDRNQLGRKIAEKYIGSIDNWLMNQKKFLYHVIEGWIVIASFSYQQITVIDIDLKRVFKENGENAEEILDHLDDLGFNKDFLDWFYESEFDNNFKTVSESDWEKSIA